MDYYDDLWRQRRPEEAYAAVVDEIRKLRRELKTTEQEIDRLRKENRSLEEALDFATSKLHKQRK